MHCYNIDNFYDSTQTELIGPHALAACGEIPDAVVGVGGSRRIAMSATLRAIGPAVSRTPAFTPSAD